MRAVVFTKSFVARLDGHERHFLGAADLTRVGPHEIYLDTPQGIQRMLRSVETAGLRCRDVKLEARPDWQLPLCLNAAPRKPTLLPRDEALIASLRERLTPGQPLRIAIFNAFGTAMGDNLVGMQAFQLLLPLLHALHPWLEVDIVRSWVSRKPEYVLGAEPWVSAVRATPLTLHAWQGYHAYFDLSGFTGLAGFLATPWPDFHLQHLGIDPAQVPGAFKRASLPVRRSEDFLRGVACVQEQCLPERGPTVFVHATASNHLRSIPRPALLSIIAGLQHSGCQLVTDDRAVVLAAREAGCPLVWVRDRSLDELRGALAAVDQVITSDTFLLHVANLAARPVIALCMAHQRYPDGMLPWQDNVTVVEVDADQRFANRFKMSDAEIASAGLTDYFQQAWQNAATAALQHLRSAIA